MIEQDKPTRALVFDAETLRLPNIEAILGVEEDLEALAEMPVEALHEFCETHEVKLGNRVKEDAIRKCARDHITKQIDRGALKLYGCQLFAIGCADLFDGNPRVWAGRKEDVILRAFVKFLATGDAILCGFNIREFDLKVIRTRCLAHGITLPHWFPEDDRADRYDRTHVFDARDILTDGRLDIWLRLFGLPPKTARGEDVASMTDDEVRQYCGDDVERERLLIQRMVPFVSRLRQMQYTGAER